jgi:hypothetical protein
MPVAPSHYDRQYTRVDWSEVPDPDFSSPLSFALPIQLPKTGGRLNVWDISEEEFEQVKQAGSKPGRTFHPYHAGELVMHSGNLLHQIAASRDMEPEDRRITLQGHGVRSGNKMYLYW